MPLSVKCPKCERPLQASGEVEFEGNTVPVYQCEECLVETEMFGEPVEIALTFAVDANGQPFDPASSDGKLKL